MRKSLVELLSALVFVSACAKEPERDVPPQPSVAATPAKSSGPTGRIRGMVQLNGSAPAPAFEPISENQNICGKEVSVSRLVVGKEKGVQHAFVYLEGVPSSETFHAR